MTAQPGSRARQGASLILSGIFPGLGQLYNREWIKGALFLAAGAILTWIFLRMAPTDPLALVEPQPRLMLAGVVLLALWLWAIADAWRVAGRPR